jgi:hypothetical protein
MLYESWLTVKPNLAPASATALFFPREFPQPAKGRKRFLPPPAASFG